MTTNQLGVAVLGAGFMGHTYAEIVARHMPETRLVGIACGSRAPGLAEKYGVGHFASPEELLARGDVDLAIVATPHAQHHGHALAALRAGRHVLVEKPMATSVVACDEMIAEADRRDLRLAVMFGQRYRACNVELKRRLDSGAAGRVLHLQHFQVVSQGMGALPGWQMQPENIGVLAGHGIHNFDALRWLTGQEIKSVYARCRSLDPSLAAEGTSDVLVTLADGTVAYIFCSFQIPAPGFPRSQFGGRITCEKALFDLDAYGELRAALAGGPWETLVTQPAVDWHGKGFLDPVRLESYIGLIRDLVNAIREHRPPAVTGWDGRQAIAAALAAYESQRTGRAIELC